MDGNTTWFKKDKIINFEKSTIYKRNKGQKITIEILDELTPNEGEAVVDKNRPSAYYNTNLNMNNNHYTILLK